MNLYLFNPLSSSKCLSYFSLGVSKTHWKTTDHITITNGNLTISLTNVQHSISAIAVIINKDIKTQF